MMCLMEEPSIIVSSLRDPQSCPHVPQLCVQFSLMFSSCCLLSEQLFAVFIIAVFRQIRKFVEICKPANCDTKLIFEVGFLTDEEIADLTKICCEEGISYVKTATGSQAFPDIDQVKIMKANLSGDTKIKVSGVPRTFVLPAAMYAFNHLGVSLIGTRSAGKIVAAYEQYLTEI